MDRRPWSQRQATAGPPPPEAGHVLVRHTVPAGIQGATLGRYLVKELGLSEGLLRKLKQLGGLWVDGMPAQSDWQLSPGMQLLVRHPGQPSPAVKAEAMALVIAHEDADVVVVDKAPGLLVHPTRTCNRGTLANGLAHHFAQKGEAPGVHPVQRLDRWTGGLLVFARHPLAHAQLAKQLQGGRLKRRYEAIAQGLVAPDRGLVAAPIAIDPSDADLRVVAPHGQPARTHFEVLGRWPEAGGGVGATRLALVLETGRTHQIRVHLKHLGHPLWGDARYAPPEVAALAPHVALHAVELAFEHPRSGEAMRFSSPAPEGWPS